MFDIFEHAARLALAPDLEEQGRVAAARFVTGKSLRNLAVNVQRIIVPPQILEDSSAKQSDEIAIR